MGAAQEAGAGALVWGATAGVRSPRAWRIGTGAALVALVAARHFRPVEAGMALAVIQVGAVLRLVTVSPRLVSRTAGAFLAVMPFVATHGPWAYAVREGRRLADWSHFALFAAGVSLAAGAVLALEAWRRRLRQATGGVEISADLRRDLRRGVEVLLR